MEYRETCDMKTRDLGEKPMLGMGLWKPILRTGFGKETYPEDRFNGISVHLACSLNRDFTKGLLNQVYHFLPVISQVLSKTYDNSP